MAAFAEWWDQPGAAVASDGKPVVRHAPNDGKYHLATDPTVRQRLGDYTALVPVARHDGRSTGFDPTRAGPVHVDPGAPDGGVIFDPASVDRRQIVAAVQDATYPHEAFYRLGRPAGHAGSGRSEFADRPVDNPHLPADSYLVQATAPDGRPLARHQEGPTVTLPTLAPLPQLAAPQLAVPQMAAPQPPQAGPPAYYPPQSQTDPAVLSYLQQIGQTLSGVGQTLANVSQRLADVEARPQARHPVGLPPVATLPAERSAAAAPAPRPAEFDDSARPIRARADNDGQGRQTVREYEEAQEPASERVIVGFETLKLDWLTGPIADKPRRKVFFTIPQAGKFSASFHDVVDSPHCVALVYDTRYEDGTQFLPPERGEEPIRIGVPHLKTEFTVLSLGLHFTLGTFDVIVLGKHEEPPDAEEYGDAG
jgi:hypothetical protein